MAAAAAIPGFVFLQLVAPIQQREIPGASAGPDIPAG
jgi:hypothetical protein